MPDRKDVFAPIEPMALSVVPRAGAQELAKHRDAVSDQRMDLLAYGALTGVIIALAVVLTSPPGIPLLLLALLSALAVGTGAKTCVTFWKLTNGRSRLYLALPEHATEASAKLEDETHRLLCQWNADVRDWNRRLEEWRAESEEWRLWQERPESRPVEWSEAFAEERRRSLSAVADALYHERRMLFRRRRDLRQRIGRLRTKMCLPSAPVPKFLTAPDEDDDPDKT